MAASLARPPPARADAAGDRLLRPPERQQRDPGLSLRQRPDRGRLARHARRRRRRPGGDPRGRRAELRRASPTTTCRRCSSSAGARREPTIVLAWTPRENVRVATEALRAPARRAVRRPPRGQRVAPLRRRRRPTGRRGPPALDRRAGPDQPADADPPDALGAVHERRRRDHGDHRGAQRVQPRRPPAPRRPARDRLRALPARTSSRRCGARRSASGPTSS